MKNSITSSYRKRLVLLGVVGVLLVGVFVKKKLLPKWHLWQQLTELQEQATTLNDLEAERSALQIELARMEILFGDPHSSDQAWRSVLDLLSRSEEGVALAQIAEEHQSTMAGLEVRTLPLSIKGRTAELVNTIDRLEAEARDVHLLSVDLRVKDAGFNRPRQLTATLYLQTLSK